MYKLFSNPNSAYKLVKPTYRTRTELNCISIRRLLVGFKLAIVTLSLSLSGCIIVDSTLDSIDINPGDGTCADSANRCTLRAAVMEANAPGVYRYSISVPEGLYSLTLPAENGGGPLNITRGMRIRGDGNDSTIIGQTQLGPVIQIEDGNDVEIDHVTVRGGNTQLGGGIKIVGGNVELEDLSIQNNFAFTGGGGLYIANGAVVRMDRSSIDGNNSRGAFGGGIYNKGDLWVYDSTISNNASNRTGGIRNSGSMRLRNVTVSGNTVSTSLAGVGGISQQGFAILNNVSVTNNTGFGNNVNSWSGGGIQTGSVDTTIINNSIVAGNDGAGGPNDCAGELAPSSRNNLIGDSNGCTITSFLSTYLLDVPADLAPLADNGGPTQTHQPQASSMARDAGYGFLPPNIDACQARDQRGVPRPQGSGACDLGAYEYTESTQFVTGIMLVNATTNADIRLVRNDDYLVLDTLPSELTLRAVVDGNPGSVKFGYDADPSFRTEDVPPYSLVGDSSGSFAAATLTSGEHTVTATPFVGADATGQAGGAITIDFYVVTE